MSFTPFKVGAPNMTAASGGGFGTTVLLPLLAAIAGMPQQQEQQKEQKAKLQGQQTENSAQQQLVAQSATTFAQQQQQYAKTQAQQQWSTLGERVLANPTWAQSPTVKNQLEGLAQTLGYPSPYNPDGSINERAFLKPLSSITDEKTREFILAQPPGAQRITAARSAGVTLTDQEASVASSFTAKAQSDFQRATNQGIHFTNMDRTNADRAASLKVLNEAHAHMYDADANLYSQRASVVQQQADAATVRATAAMRNADAHMVSANAAMKRAAESIRGNQGLSQHFYRLATDEVSRAERDYAGADAAYQDAFSKGADDSVLQPLENARNKAHGVMTQAQAQLSILKTEYDGNAGHAHSVNSASNSRSTSVTHAGKKPPSSQFTPGKVYTDKNGNRAKYNADETWTPQ